MSKLKRKVTIIYYDDAGLELHHAVRTFDENDHGRVIIPADFKEGKSILAVCDGEIQILNRIGDRILSVSYIA